LLITLAIIDLSSLTISSPIIALLLTSTVSLKLSVSRIGSFSSNDSNIAKTLTASG